MADTTVDAACYTTLYATNGLWGPYWITPLVAIIVYLDNGQDISFARTTDGGSNWSKTELDTGTHRHVACWFDKETPGNTGTLVHVAWLAYVDGAGGDLCYYQTLDVSDGSTGTRRTVSTGLSMTSGDNLNRIAVTQTLSGNIILALSTPTEIECWKSSDNFATAGTQIADAYDAANLDDWLLLFPAATGDNNDACGIFWDASATEISLKMYDDSLDSWTETSVATSMIRASLYMGMDGSVRHSDGHVVATAHSSMDSAGDDLLTWDLTVDSIAAPTVTAKTNIFTDQAESAQASVFVNQQNDDIYIAYLKGGTWGATVNVVYHKSVDGMANWGAEQAYDQDGADDNRLVHGGRTVGDAGGRYQPSWFNDDMNDIFVNEVNDVEIAAAEAPTGFAYSQAVII